MINLPPITNKNSPFLTGESGGERVVGRSGKEYNGGVLR